MDKLKMRCDRCDFIEEIHTMDKKETEAKVPFYRCPKCHIGSLKKINTKENK